MDPIPKILEEHGYIQERKIGKGAQGECYVVFSTKYRTNFVCKVFKMSIGYEESTKRDFESEIFMLSHIIHPNIVKIYDHFSSEQYLFMIIEYCSNGCLKTIVKEKPFFIKSEDEYNFQFIRKLMFNILSALSYCHDERHISHHDIKPSNILIDSFGQAKLCDFGISNFIDSNYGFDAPTEDQKNHNCAGTLPFMSPQLIATSFNSDSSFDWYKADIWAFGVTMFFVLTKTYPFAGNSKQMILTKHNCYFHSPTYGSRKNPIFKDIPPDTPDDIFTVIQKCLIIDERARPSAKELMNILNQAREPSSFGSQFPKVTNSLSRRDVHASKRRLCSSNISPCKSISGNPANSILCPKRSHPTIRPVIKAQTFIV